MAELQEYIESGGGYKQGVSILERLNPFASELVELRKYIDQRFAPTAAQELLRKTLLTYYQKPPVASEIATPSVVEPVKEVPAIILKLREEQRFLRDERRAIHYCLEDYMEQSDRASIAQQIRSLTNRINAIFNQLDDWELNGNVPNVATVGDARAGGLEVLELTKKEKYFRERISRLKVWVEDKTLPLSKRERLKTELTLKISELAVIEQTLKTLKNNERS